MKLGHYVSSLRLFWGVNLALTLIKWSQISIAYCEGMWACSNREVGVDRLNVCLWFVFVIFNWATVIEATSFKLANLQNAGTHDSNGNEIWGNCGLHFQKPMEDRRVVFPLSFLPSSGYALNQLMARPDRWATIGCIGTEGWNSISL